MHICFAKRKFTTETTQLRFIDVILPVPLRRTFTYHLDNDDIEVAVGARVVVNFGGQKFVTGIIKDYNAPKPTDYETKEISTILDTKPLVTDDQIKMWQWMAEYYMCSIGEVMKAALPSGLRMENKAKAFLNPSYAGQEQLKANEAKIYNYLADGQAAELSKLAKHIGVKNIAPLLRRLIDKKVIDIEDDLRHKYTPKYKVYFHLAERLKDDSALEEAFVQIKSAKKQQAFLYTLLSDYKKDELVNKSIFLKKNGISTAVYNEILKKGFITEELKEISRFEINTKPTQAIKELSKEQTKALTIAKDYFTQNKPVLLHGVTASGKTEVYIHLIREQLDKGKQVLFLLPEIAITIEMLQRLTDIFGDKISIYHSRYSDAQRVEVWHKINESKEGHLVIGARSAVFLPFRNLGLIVVDEEHEDSYKQSEPAPYYHARDVAVMMSHQNNANIILGSATPSIESSYNGQRGKYGVTHLMERYTQVALPNIEAIDMAESYKKNRTKHHFSFELINAIKETLERKEQVILFQNRRGYSGFVECKACGYVPQCKNCDISLTYHQFRNKLSCHYCGNEEEYTEICPKCGEHEISTKGMGTEKVTEQAKEIFPKAHIQRFDQDSTKGKGDFERIITNFQDRKTDILVGTQMIAKGLDFDNVGLVAIMNADNLMNYPDFRSHEKAYQMMSQVSGRSGRRHKQGQVILQSYTPDYSLIKSVKSYDFSNYYKQQLAERKEFNYPPFVKLIDITVRHRDWRISNTAAQLLADKIRDKFGNNVLGPEAPAVSRVKLLYLNKIMLKVDTNYPLQATKNWLLALVDALKENEQLKSISVIFDVDV